MDYQNHVGMISTDMMHSWVNKFEGFTQITLILKSLLKKKLLNDSYKGGITSFCLAVMLVAVYPASHPYQKVTDIPPLKMLERVLDKYGNEFNPDLQGVYLQQDIGYNYTL